ncbi:hypothetical protein [Flavisolibacter ginsenosidimutans]|uniref:Uncharacterized protein n=1 Tax=Flavisolibacter ginsenosidimutans TaxID=661481 RepID=A0A5B8UDM4_9BACT|nr:hypothetical protein [Flavisolibacter ginsenosidimutans]QEC54777.1 hypothetical protein FSB75_02295 [Flavisolibacter ginsenosidimutans]
MARIAGIQTINNPQTGEVEKLVIDIDKAMKNKQMSSIIEDLLDHMAIVKAKKSGSFILWSEARARIDKKFGFK